MPAENQAAVTLQSSGAGISVDPANSQHAIATLLSLLADPDTRTRMGAAGRQYAEAKFDISMIGSRFESVLKEVNGLSESRARARIHSGKN